MKCINCGADVRLTDKVCPYCGRVIKENAGYRADMEYYKRDSAKTKKKVREILSENIPIVISAIILVVLLIADGVLLYVQENAFQDYLDAGDYAGFSAFEEYHNIAEWEPPYDDLNLLCDMAKEYSSLVSAVEEVTMFGPDAKWYRPESDIRSCRSAIWYFNFQFEHNLSKIDEDPYKDYIYDMKAKADTIMEVYLGLDEAGRDEYFASSSNKQEAYLEEVLLHD